MFVSESTLSFMGTTKLQVMSAEGRLWEGGVDPSLTVEALKQLIFAHFYPQETSLGPDNYRIIFPKESRSLGDTRSIHEEHLEENDVLFFIRRRSANAPDSDKDLESQKTPTAQDIANATKDLPLPPPPIPKTNQQQASSSGGGRHTHFAEESSTIEASVDFQLELRKIIISLVSVMATLLHANPDADLICQQIHSRLKRRLQASSSKPVEGTTFTYPPPPEVLCTPLGIVAGLGEVRKREFRPNAKAMDALKEKGFKDEGQIIEALRATKNLKEAAGELLASGKKQLDAQTNAIEAGLDPQSHLFTALVSAPTVRLGLSNPKTLLAFLNILESPAAANVWLNDTDTAPVLSTIFKIYHAEKHAAPAES